MVSYTSILISSEKISMNYDNSSISKWIIIFSLIAIISISVGLIFEIPAIQIAGAVIISLVLVISAFVFQRIGSKFSSRDDPYSNTPNDKTSK